MAKSLSFSLQQEQLEILRGLQEEGWANSDILKFAIEFLGTQSEDERKYILKLYREKAQSNKLTQ